eukprot:s6179_g4.t1
MEGWMDGWMDGWMAGWRDGCMDAWTDGLVLTQQRTPTSAQEHIDADRSLWVSLRKHRVALPWRWVLRCPCLVYLSTLLAVFALIGIGVVSAPISLNTNFDSLMESDSAASLNYDAILQAILDARRERQGRRLSPGDFGRPGRGSGSRLWSTPERNASELGLTAEDGEPVPPGRRLQSRLKLYKPYRFELTYVRRDDGNVLSASTLDYMRSIEKEVRSMEPFRKLCETAEPRFKHHCDPGISMVNVMYPFSVPDGVDARIYFNGTGTASLLPVAVSLAQQERLTEAVWPEGLANDEVKLVGSKTCGDGVPDCAKWKDAGHCLPGAAHEVFMQDFCKATCGICDEVPEQESASETAEGLTEITALRSYFALQAFCCEAGEPGQGQIVSEMDAVWNAFVAELVELLTQKNANRGAVRVFFSGDGISSYETFAAVGGDAMFAIMSYCFVLVYATLHTRSPFLALVGLSLVMLSIPASFAVFMLASGSGELSLMMCLSVFIVIGVGSDMLFVYTDFYKQSLLFTRDPAERLKFTYLQAASSTAATTFTTAMSFFANLASVLRPLREFGFFMGVCVTLAWLMVLMAYPAVLIMGERLQNCCRRCILQQPQDQGPSRKSFVNAAKRKSLVMLADALDPEKKGVGAAHSSCLGDYLAVSLGKFKYPVVLLFTGLTALQAYMSLTTMEQASGIPQTFPDDHNQEAQQKYNGLFATYDFTAFPAGAYAAFTLKCSSLGRGCLVKERGFRTWEWRSLFRFCSLHHCETHGRHLGSLQSCDCVTHQSAAPSAADGCGRYQVQTRVVGRSGLEPEHLQSSDLEQLMYDLIPNASSVTVVGADTTSSLLETLHWDSGDVDLRVMLQVPTATVEKGSGRSCATNLLCYCGVQPCDGPPSGSPDSAATLHLDRVAQALFSSRRLATSTTAPEPLVPVELQTDVLVVFGLKVTGTNPLLGVSKEEPYGFSEEFKLEDPWAQRRSLALCENFPEELKVVSVQCWLKGFKEWWTGKGEEWPVRPNVKNFHAEAWWYANNRKTGPFETIRYVWFSEDQRLIAMYFQFFINVNRLGGSSSGMDAMLKWDRHLAAFNSQAEAPIKGAWHASRVWTIAEAEKVILDSTLVTLCISLGCVFLGVLVFTRSTHLSLIVMLVVMMIVLGLLFFMVIIMSWKIGAIEVLSLIVFVGFAVDYCLHLSHKYHSCHITDVEEQDDEDEEEEEDQEPQSVATRLQNIGRKSISMAAGATKPGKSGNHRVSMKISDIAVTKATTEKREQNKRVLSKNRSAERFERSKYALERIGGSIVGSALTTIGSACFLLPCTMHVFFKLGAVVCGVTAYAVVFALVPLPAVLMCFGPCGHDFRSILELIGRAAQNLMPEDEEEEDDEETPSASQFSTAWSTGATCSTCPARAWAKSGTPRMSSPLAQESPFMAELSGFGFASETSFVVDACAALTRFRHLGGRCGGARGVRLERCGRLGEPAAKPASHGRLRRGPGARGGLTMSGHVTSTQVADLAAGGGGADASPCRIQDVQSFCETVQLVFPSWQSQQQHSDLGMTVLAGIAALYDHPETQQPEQSQRRSKSQSRRKSKIPER